MQSLFFSVHHSRELCFDWKMSIKDSIFWTYFLSFFRIEATLGDRSTLAENKKADQELQFNLIMLGEVISVKMLSVLPPGNIYIYFFSIFFSNFQIFLMCIYLFRPKQCFVQTYGQVVSSFWQSFNVRFEGWIWNGFKCFGKSFVQPLSYETLTKLLHR